MNNEYTKKAAFINRKNELQFLHDHVTKEPENILFIYGPKSSGKTTLINKFVDELKKDKTKKYDILQHNLREISISRYEDFIRTFFNIQDENQQSKTTTVGLSVGVFTISKETAQQMAQHNIEPFKIMKEEFIKLNKKGIRPLLIIDELQALEGIYLNGQKELLKELFNFFVAMTKESHLCHVFIASSDGYFIERIYEDSKLKKTSTFFEVKYLSKEDTFYWLNNVEKESAIKEYVLTEQQKEQIWDFFGGSCWEVSDFLGALQSGAKDKVVPQDFFEEQLHICKITQRSLFVINVKKEKHQKLFLIIHSVHQKNGIITVDLLMSHLLSDYSRSELIEELKILVTKNILAFNPTTAEYALQGRSMEIGMEEFAKMIKQN